MTKCDSGITESARYTGRPAGYRDGSAVLRPPTQLLLLQTAQTLTIFAVTNRASNTVPMSNILLLCFNRELVWTLCVLITYSNNYSFIVLRFSLFPQILHFVKIYVTVFQNMSV